MKLLLFISIFFQDSLPPVRDGLPSQPQLFAALDTFYHSQTIAELSEYESTNEKQWLKYLPTVGLSYTFDGKPRPTVNWSSNLIYSSYRDKETKEAKRLSIIRKNELKHEKDKLKLHALIQKHHAFEEDIQFLQSLLEYDTQLLSVKQDQADHLEITPSELLKAKQAYQKKAYEIFQKERSLDELEWEILLLAHYFNYDTKNNLSISP